MTTFKRDDALPFVMRYLETQDPAVLVEMRKALGLPEPGFKRTGHRPSSLPIAQFCGMAPKIGAQHGAGRSAAMSSAFHAKCAGVEGWQAKWARLSDEEQAEVSRWHVPTDVVLPNGAKLRYADAQKEVRVGVDDMGWYADPEEQDVLTDGTLDFGWVRELEGGIRVAYVADIKRQTFTVKDAPEDSLQLHLYGWAFAAMTGCDMYSVGFFFAEEGEWSWSSEMVDPLSDRGKILWMRIHAAASNTDEEYNSGPHCKGCWSRLHCPEYALPASVAEQLLGPIAHGEVPAPADFAKRIQDAQATKEIADIALRQMQAWIAAGAATAEADGKKYVATTRNGRSSVSVENLRKGLGAEADKYITKGKPYEQWGWVKA